MYSVVVPNSEVPGELGVTHRNNSPLGQAVTIDGCSTIYECFLLGLCKVPNSPFVGSRIPFVNPEFDTLMTQEQISNSTNIERSSISTAEHQNKVQASKLQSQQIVDMEKFKAAQKIASDSRASDSARVIFDIATHEQTPKPNFQFISYSTAHTRILRIRTGFMLLGIWTNTKTIQFSGVCLMNCPEYILVELAGFSIGVTSVPLYYVVPLSVIINGIAETMLETLVTTVAKAREILEYITNLPETNESGISSLSKRIAEGKLCRDDIKLKSIVLIDTNEKIESYRGIIIYSLLEVERACSAFSGKDISSDIVIPPPAYSSTPAYICFTSGTTGFPKAAVITHQNSIAVVHAVQTAMISLSHTDVHLSYLPLAHCFERALQAICYHGGVAVGFFSQDISILVEDLCSLKPTVFITVPRLLNKFHQAIMAKLCPINEENNNNSLISGLLKKATGRSRKSIKQMVVERALITKLTSIKNKTKSSVLYDKFIFSKLKNELGLSRVRMVLSGSAPLTPEVWNFFRTILNVPIVQGYGQTETAAGLSITPLYDLSCDCVGPPLVCCEVALRDIPAQGYTQLDNSHEGQPCLGRGEVCVRGVAVIPGYWDADKQGINPLKLLNNQWLPTGDVGLWKPDGQLKLIDRVNNFVKLAQGEFIAVENLEGVFQAAEQVEQIWVHADSTWDSLVVVVVPTMQTTEEELIQEFRSIIIANKLPSYNIPVRALITNEEFTVDNALLTPTFKLVRRELVKKYGEQLKKMYIEHKQILTPIYAKM